jgi:hypothetical protein
MTKKLLTLFIYTILFFLVPFVGILGPLGYIGVKHHVSYTNFLNKHKILGPFLVYFCVSLQFVLSCVIINQLRS